MTPRQTLTMAFIEALEELGDVNTREVVDAAVDILLLAVLAYLTRGKLPSSPYVAAFMKSFARETRFAVNGALALGFETEGEA